jgi:hypothetical protein
MRFESISYGLDRHLNAQCSILQFLCGLARRNSRLAGFV